MSEGEGIFSSRAAWALVPNPISGPGVYPEVVDFSFVTEAESTYGAKAIKTLINQPLLLPSGLCQRNTYYFTNATAEQVFRSGNVTFGPGADGAGITTGELMSASAGGVGIYGGVEGLGACAQLVGYNPEDCDTAVANVDPASLD